VGVTAGLVESNGSLPPGLWLTSPASWLSRTGMSPGSLRSVVEYIGYLYLTDVLCELCHCPNYAVYANTAWSAWSWWSRRFITACSQHMLWTDLQQVDPVTRRVHWSRASASRLDWLQRNYRTAVCVQSVRAPWTLPLENTCSELWFSSVHVQWTDLKCCYLLTPHCVYGAVLASYCAAISLSHACISAATSDTAKRCRSVVVSICLH